MTSPAKPPAPMEPLKPCPFCGSKAETGKRNGSARCSNVSCGASAYWVMTIHAWNNRRAAPAPTDGEVGELVRELASIETPPESAHEMTAKAWKQYDLFCTRLPAIRNALSRQSAELAEARQGKLAADLRADGWKALSEQATAALTALGCKLGPEGWMRPCECGTRGCETFHPIPGAGAKAARMEITQYGFVWGPATVVRLCEWPGIGVFIAINGKRQTAEIRVTPAGNVIVDHRAGKTCKLRRLK